MSWESNVRKVVPYTPGEQPKAADIVKLNTNENPYPPSPRVAEAIRTLDPNRMRLYPDPKIEDLVHAIALVYGRKDEEVFVGIGSDDVLAMCFMTYFNSEKPILFPDITYSFYDVWAEMLRIPYSTQPLDDHFHIRPQDYMRENGGIVFPNPNAPTGSVLPLSEIEEIVKGNPDSVVIVDEAYVDFGAESALPLIDKYENVIITQTFSKSRSLAGVRVGYAFANPKMIKYLNDVKYSFNSYTMNYPGILLGTAEVLDTVHFRKNCEKIMRTRANASARFRELGFSFDESCSNFLFVTHERVPAKEIFEHLRTKHIYVRWFNKPRIDNYLRVTVGTDEEMERLFSALEEFV
ncbi:MAG: histidinol-phosphate transaminase [Lachnospiraceae bacterium]|nr:histidinol-phosphate transaminase [Lachnospiraceae bacterium]